ncbi:MAG TPA: hypothetical protein VJ747_00435 [Stellaceae bacterium]|nr:hypothetical protein [Stellaceae bacterium]
MQLVQRPQDQALIVNLTLNRTPIGDNFIIYQDKKRLLVPLGGIMAAFEVAITTDPEAGTASGFFINEKRRFDLDLRTGKATFDGRSFVLEPGSVERQLTDIYVDSTLLTDWFSIRFHLVSEDLTLLSSSVELLPVEERMERERRRAGVRRPGEAGDYTIVEPPAKIVDWPFVDTSIQYSTTRTNRQMQNQGQYSSIVTGMVGGLDLDMSVNGTVPQQSYQNFLRATLGQRDPRGGLLGPIDAREFAFGDVSSPSLPLVSNSVAGRGAMLSTFPLHRVSDLQRVTLRGELPVGWQVELYRGADLLNYQTSSSDGRYEFLNVPTIPGLNAFRLVFYGPEGQRREEEKPIYVAAAAVGAGETGYSLLFNQQNTDLFGNHPNAQLQPTTAFTRFDQLTQALAQPNTNDGGLRFNAEVEHGLSDNFSVNGAVSSLPIGNTQIQYFQTGLRAAWLGALSNLSAATSNNGGVAAGTSVQSQFDSLSWQLSYDRFLDHFLSERSFDLILNQPLVATSGVQLNGLLPGFGSGRLPFATSATYSEAENGQSHLELRGRLSSYISRFTVAAETQSEVISHQTAQTQEIIRIGTQFGRIGLRGETIYNLTPTAELSATQLTADFAARQNLNLRLGVTRLQTEPKETQFTAGAAVLFDRLALGTDASVSDRGDFSLLFKIAFSFGMQPRGNEPVFRSQTFARSGAISPLVFLDRDGDGKFGPGDTPLPNVKLRGDNFVFRDKTDQSGTALITGLDPYQETPVRVDTETLEDPYWKPADQNIAVLPRPGSVVKLEFPVYETGEVDGAVEMERGGQRVPLPGIRLQVIDSTGKVVSQALSGYDGSFFVQGVRLGSYTLRADPEQLGRLHLTVAPPQAIALTHDNPAATASTITLAHDGGSRAEAIDAPPAPSVPPASPTPPTASPAHP